MLPALKVWLFPEVVDLVRDVLGKRERGGESLPEVYQALAKRILG